MKKIILSLCAVTLLLTSLSAGGSQEAVSTPLPAEAVKIALLNGPSGIGLIQVKDQSPFSDDSIPVDVRIMGAPKVLLGQMLKEEWDAAVLPANMAAVLFNKGVGYQAAAVTGLGNLYLITKEETVVDSMEDLESLTVHVPGKHTTPDLITQLIAQEKGVSIKMDYSFNPSDLAKAVVGGVVEAAILPEPLATIALMKGDNLKMAMDMQTLWSQSFEGESDYPMTLLVVKSSFLSSYPELVDQLLEASAASLDWVVSNPEEASLLIQEHGFTLPPPIVKLAIPGSNYAYIAGEDMDSLMTPYYERLKTLNPATIGGTVPAGEFYYKP